MAVALVTHSLSSVKQNDDDAKMEILDDDDDVLDDIRPTTRGLSIGESTHKGTIDIKDDNRIYLADDSVKPSKSLLDMAPSFSKNINDDELKRNQAAIMKDIERRKSKKVSKRRISKYIDYNEHDICNQTLYILVNAIRFLLLSLLILIADFSFHKHNTDSFDKCDQNNGYQYYLFANIIKPKSLWNYYQILTIFGLIISCIYCGILFLIYKYRNYPLMSIYLLFDNIIVACFIFYIAVKLEQYNIRNDTSMLIYVYIYIT